MGRLDSQVVFTLNFWTSVRYAMSHEVDPWWQLFFLGTSITSTLNFQRRRGVYEAEKTIINTTIC